MVGPPASKRSALAWQYLAHRRDSPRDSAIFLGRSRGERCWAMELGDLLDSDVHQYIHDAIYGFEARSSTGFVPLHRFPAGSGVI